MSSWKDTNKKTTTTQPPLKSLELWGVNSCRNFQAWLDKQQAPWQQPTHMRPKAQLRGVRHKREMKVSVLNKKNKKKTGRSTCVHILFGCIGVCSHLCSEESRRTTRRCRARMGRRWKASNGCSLPGTSWCCLNVKTRGLDSGKKSWKKWEIGKKNDMFIQMLPVDVAADETDQAAVCVSPPPPLYKEVFLHFLHPPLSHWTAAPPASPVYHDCFPGTPPPAPLSSLLMPLDTLLLSWIIYTCCTRWKPNGTKLCEVRLW